MSPRGGPAMILGVLSDTHDNRDAVRSAVRLFTAEGVDAVLHLGDVCGPGAIEDLGGLGVPLYGVFGNNDVDKAGLQAVSGNGFREGPREVRIDGRAILMAHAFDELSGRLEERGKFDLVLFGHTHRPLEMRIGRALVLNPGEGCGFSRGRQTCALVDLSGMKGRILEIPSGEGNGGR